MSDASDLIELLDKNPEWTRISGDDFEEQETEDGTKFDAVIEIRETEPAGWTSTYFAVLDVNGDWDEPPTFDDEED